jgi:hypothetical protein
VIRLPNREKPIARSMKLIAIAAKLVDIFFL